jgi:hypothetical protein
MTSPLSGGCSCGAVRYQLTRPPMFVHCCHCLLCQRQTGSAFVINGLIETACLVVTGQPSLNPMPTESGRPHDVFRCPACQVALFSDYGRRPTLRFVRLATLDAPHTFTPDVHIFTRSKVPWVVLPMGARAFPEYYQLEQEWPPESLARRRAILP